MPNPRGLIASYALAGGLLACAVEPGEPTSDALGASSAATSVLACQFDPYYCYSEPFALGAWVGDTGPFAALVLSDQLCGDYGFCFVGDLTNGTRIEGYYFHRPQLAHFSWSGSGRGFEGYSVAGNILTFYAGPEDSIVPVATLHRMGSYCDVPTDCELQSLRRMPCDPPVMVCQRHACKQNCGRRPGR
jgi:hypothetical protein